MKQFLAVATVCGVLAGAAVRYLPAVGADDRPAPVTKESSLAFRKVVKQVLPAVVSIRTEVKAKTDGQQRPRRRNFEFRGDIPEEFREQLEEMLEGPVNGRQMPSRRVMGFGSGVIVSPDGVILTNNHVVENASTVTVVLQDGKTFVSKDVKTDPKTDLAIIKIDAGGKALPYATLGDSNSLEIGDWVLAMGAPFELSGSVTAGIISAKGRQIGQSLRDSKLMYQDFLQTDAAINPGNSGGPLVDLDGKIIGINTAIESRTGTFAGVGFAIPTSIAGRVVDQLVKHGKVKRSYLGVTMTEVQDEVADRLAIKDGVIINEVYDNTPAAKAGLKPTDIVVAVNNQPIESSKQLQSIVSDTEPGTTLKFTVVPTRGESKRQTIAVKLEEQPENFGPYRMTQEARSSAPDQSVSLNELGLKVMEKPEGLVVSEVDPNGLAATAIEAGSVIVSVERKDVKTMDQLKAALKTAKLAEQGVLLTIKTPDGAMRIVNLRKN